MAKVSRTRIASVIADRARQGDKRLPTEVAAYLLESGRVRELDSILRDVQDNWARDGYVEVLAASAHPLTEAIKTDIIGRVRPVLPAGATITVTEVRDPEVVGGVRLRLANQQLDLSVEAKLNKFKQLTRD